jgi:hypothetical protein
MLHESVNFFLFKLGLLVDEWGKLGELCNSLWLGVRMNSQSVRLIGILQ